MFKAPLNTSKFRGGKKIQNNSGCNPNFENKPFKATLETRKANKTF